jgi:membrane-bound ClpP family serine protease
MVGVYGRYRDQRDRDENRWIMGIIEEAKAEQERNPMSTERMLKESDRLSRHGARQAQKLGIRQQDIDRIVHDYRARKQA